MRNKISGVILAGGKNRRFGGITKANIVIEGKTIISRIVSVIGEIFNDVIIVTNKPEEFREFTHFKIVADQILNAGPLGGIHSALKSTSEDAIFVFAGDMPFPDKTIIADLINEFENGRYDIIVPRIDTDIEPLHALYRKSIVEDLERFLSERKSKAVHDFLKETNVGYFQIAQTEKSRLAFTNINSPEDLAKIDLKL